MIKPLISKNAIRCQLIIRNAKRENAARKDARKIAPQLQAIQRNVISQRLPAVHLTNFS